jgi:UDP-glucose 4-epimerase
MTELARARFVVTGGAGFIGGAMAAALGQRGAEVVIVDLPDKIAELSDPGSHRYVVGDVSDARTYRELSRFAPFDGVLHLAAQTSNRVSHEEPERDVLTNALGTLRLVEWCCASGIQRLLFSSSMAVYGHPVRLPCSESDPVNPFSYYGITKLAGEHYIRANVERGLKPTIFRLFNVYGPGQNMRNLKQGMASIYLAYALRGEKIPITGSLDRFRDFVYIDDVVDAWLRALHEPSTCGQTFNLGTGRSTTVRDLLRLIIGAAGEDPVTYPVEQVAGHFGDQFGMTADATAFRAATGWAPTVRLEEGIRRMTEWAKITISHHPAG